MRDWLEIALHPECVTSIFAITPQLNSVRVPVLSFSEDGPQLGVGVILNEYPENPPEKWIKRQCNEVRIGLEFFELYEVVVTKWGRNNVVDINFQLIPTDTSRELIAFQILGEHTDIRGKCSWLNVSSVSAYATGRG